MRSSHPPPPRASSLGEARALLDGALLALRRLRDAAIPRDRAEEHLARALRHCYSAAAATTAGSFGDLRLHIERAREEARGALMALQAVPSEDPGLGEALSSAAQALGRLGEGGILPEGGLELPTPKDPDELALASRFEPQLFRLARHVLRPRVPLDALGEPDPEPELAAAPPEIADLAALRARMAETQAKLEGFERGPGEEEREEEGEEEGASPILPEEGDEEAYLEHFGRAIGDEELLDERALDCLTELSSFGHARRKLPLEPWCSGDDMEERMLRRMDALIAIGPERFPNLVRALDDRPVPDPDLVFGTLFVFGSLKGDDSLDQCARILRSVELDEATLQMATDALALAPHPEIPERLRPWLESAEEGQRRLATEVLRRRRALAPEEARRAARDPHPSIRRSAAVALRDVPGAPLLDALSMLLREEEEEVLEGAIESALLLRREEGYRRAAEICREGRAGFARAALYVGVAGGRGDADLLLESLASSGSPLVLRALGWLGDPGAVPLLLGRLRLGDEEARPQALWALERITGASLTEVRPEPRYDPEDLPFARASTRAKRAHEPEADLSDDPDLWERWWRAHGRRAEGHLRYRFGGAYSPEDSLLELSHHETTSDDHALARAELGLRAGAETPLDAEHFIHRQRKQIERWRGHIPASILSSGESWRVRWAGS